MKKYLFFKVFMLLTVSSFSQQLKDAVHLKNGGLIYGSILEIIPDSTIKVQTAEGSIFIYRMDEIEKITKEQMQKPGMKDSVPSNEILRGYKGFFNVYKGLGAMDLLEFNTSHGFQKTPYFYLGGGIGLFSIDNENLIFMPLFNTRLNLTKSPITPFVDLKLGYGISARGGLNLNPSLGFRSGGPGAAIIVSAGYVYNEGTSFLTNNDPDNFSAHLFYLGVGCEF